MHGVRRALVPIALLAALALGPAAPGARAAADGATARAQVVEWAKAQTGARERGTTNCSPTIDRWERDMGLRVPPCRPWCGAFVHQAYLRVGVRLSSRLIDPDRTYRDALAGRRGLRAIPKDQVRPGDLLLFAFRPGLLASHEAIVTARPRGGRVSTVEGNVSHAVRRERRGLRFAVLAVRVRI
jgi:cell wall-associated NlpC family hydrolase